MAGTASTLDTTFYVAKTGLATSVSLVASTSFSTVGRNFTITSGTLNVAGFAFSVNNTITISSGGRLLCNGGTATAGSWSISGEVSCGSGQGITWTGSAGDNLWSTATNWTNNTVPGASDAALFNASVCVGAACNAQINSNLSVRGINLQSTYTGTLTQNSTRTLTLGTAGFSQAGGTYAGGDAAVTMNGPFALSGGTYTATSNTWTQSGNMTVSGAPTFNHNSGLLFFYVNGISQSITPGTLSYNHVTLGGYTATLNLNGGTLTAVGTVTITEIWYGGYINNGTVDARGDIIASSYGKQGTATILINGTGAQLVSGVSDAWLPSVQINKSSGTLTLAGTLFLGGSWTYTAGTVDAGTSTLNFAIPGVTQQIIPGSVIYNNVTFSGTSTTQNLNGGTMTVAGTLTVTENWYGGYINNGTIEARGNVIASGYGKQGTAAILINGTGAQSLTGVASSSWLPSIQINKPSGTLTLAGTLVLSRSWTYTAGTVDAGASTLSFEIGGVTQQIIPGSVIYNNVTFSGSTTAQNLNGGTMIVGGTLTVTETWYGGTINNGTIEARGNVIASGYGKQGTAAILINGTGAQTLTGAANAWLPSIQINKSSGTLTLAGTVVLSSSWTYTAGTVDAGTSTLSFEIGGGTQQIIPGSVNYNNVIFSGSATTQNLNGGTMTVGGTLTITDSWYIGYINNGTIEARGNVVSSSYGKQGTANLIINGTSTNTLTWTASSYLSTTVTIAKTGGASLTLASNTAFSTTGSDLTLSSGTFDLNGYDLSVNDILSVSVGATLKCNGGEFTSGTLSNSGTVNCPGYSTYDFNWTGAGGNANWTTAGNWQGGVAPAASDVVVFQDTYCGANCNSTVNANSSVRGLRMFSPYTATITQGSGNTLTVGARGWTQNAGTFTGGNSAITLNGNFALTSGTFTSTSGSLNVARNWTISGGTFNHNNGTFQLTNTTASTLIPSTASYNHVSIPSVGACPSWALTGTMDIDGNLSVASDGWCGALRPFDGGTLRLYGNLTMANSGFTGTTTITMAGNAAGQTINGNGIPMPSLTINAGANDVTFNGVVRTLGNYTMTSVGNLIVAGSTLSFGGYNPITITPGNVVYNNVSLDASGTCRNTSLNAGTLNVGGTLTLGSDGFCGATRTLNNGTISARGNVDVLSLGLPGTAALNFTGTINTILAMDASAQIPQGAVVINKTAGANITLSAAARFNTIAGQNLTITAGTLDMAGFNLMVANNISNSGTLQRGTNPTCGTITQGGSYSGAAAICP